MLNEVQITNTKAESWQEIKKAQIFKVQPLKFVCYEDFRMSLNAPKEKTHIMSYNSVDIDKNTYHQICAYLWHIR